MNTHVGGMERLKCISELPITNVQTGCTITLRDLEAVYSDEWLLAISGQTVVS